MVGTPKTKQKKFQKRHNLANKMDGFVKEEVSKKKKYINKYNYTYINIKRYFNTIIGRVRLLITPIDFKKITIDLVKWLSEAMIEGVAINFALHHLFNQPFTLPISLSCGIILKEFLYLIERLLKNGSTK
jgi:hypothetical protein